QVLHDATKARAKLQEVVSKKDLGCMQLSSRFFDANAGRRYVSASFTMEGYSVIGTNIGSTL
ncbi:MAG TPA: hypothetical protein VNI77_02435, partial [Nitrososphaera sp.]|nr:hypothetical protein [Nitrososphaera sp.]